MKGCPIDSEWGTKCAIIVCDEARELAVIANRATPHFVAFFVPRFVVYASSTKLATKLATKMRRKCIACLDGTN